MQQLHDRTKAWAADAPYILAHYYPWYIANDWSRHPFSGRPLLGTYGTNNVHTAARHIDWCAEYGIDGLFISWWGREHLAGRHLEDGLMRAPNLGKIQFAMFYESLGLLDHLDGVLDHVADFAHPAVFARVVEDFTYLAQRYFSHPQYLRYNGRPVVGFYVTRVFKNFTGDHLRRLREATGCDLYVIADEVFYGKQASPATSRHGPGLFDAYTAYNMFENYFVREGEFAHAYQTREAFPVFKAWGQHVPVIPSVFATYCDFRGHRCVAGSKQGFAQSLEAAMLLAKQSPHPAPSLILVTSFNEWWEGSAIEPSYAAGTAYLEAIKAFKARSSLAERLTRDASRQTVASILNALRRLPGVGS